MARPKIASLEKLLPAAGPSPKRCFWAESDPLLAVYHDEEWGIPVHDDRQWFEKIVLDGAQAGLSWLTILRKREGYRQAFVGFDPRRVAKFSDDDVERLMQNPAIVRNRAKIRSAIGNAKAFLALQKAEGSFDAFIWRFVDGKPLQGQRRDRTEVPARTELSDEISRVLRARGFSFVGTTIVYAFMQAAGLVNDHLVDCHRSAAAAGDAPRPKKARAAAQSDARSKSRPVGLRRRNALPDIAQATGDAAAQARDSHDDLE